MREHLQLVLASDACHHGTNLGIRERGVDVSGPLGWRRVRSTGRRVLDGDETELVAETA